MAYGRGVGVAMALMLAAVNACSAETSGRSGGSSVAAECTSIIEFDGREYIGHYEVMQQPDVASQIGHASYQVCNDNPGAAVQDNEPEDESFEIVALEGVDPSLAIYGNGVVFIEREQYEASGWTMPAALAEVFNRPTCSSSEPFEITGQWLSIDGENADEQGLEAPYRIEIAISDTDLEALLDTRVIVTVTDQTSPTLNTPDIKSVLWEGGDVSAQLQCDGDRFEAISVQPAAT
jgi:hypothetical protein